MVKKKIKIEIETEQREMRTETKTKTERTGRKFEMVEFEVWIKCKILEDFKR